MLKDVANCQKADSDMYPSIKKRKDQTCPMAPDADARSISSEGASRASGEAQAVSSKVIDRLLAVTVFVLVMILYMLTLAPTIVAGDAGELVTAATEFGVAHPPGYPLWCLLVGTWMRLFSAHADPAGLANVFSAICGALTCAIVYVIGRRAGAGQLASFGGALLLGASRELWAQSVIAEVYSLNAVLFALGILCLVTWDQCRNTRWLILFSFVLGIGLANHHTIGILGPIGLAWVLTRQWRVILRPGLVLGSVVAFAVPLSLYLYLPLRALADPYMNWGAPKDVSSVWSHISRAQYKSNYEPASRNLLNFVFQVQAYGRFFVHQFSPLVGLLLLGIVPWFIVRRRKAVWLYLFIMALVVLVFFGYTLNTKPERQEMVANQVFFIPVYLIVALLAMGPMDEAIRFIRTRAAYGKTFWLNRAIIGCVALLPVGLALAHNYPVNDYSRYYFAQDHARNIFVTMEDNAVIFPSGDHNTFPLVYYHQVEKVRPDVTIADKYGYIEARDFPDLSRQLENRREQRDGTIQADASVGDKPDVDVQPADRLPRGIVIDWLLRNTDRPLYFTVKTSLPDIPNVTQVQTGILYRVAKRPPPPSHRPDAIWRKYRYRNLDEGFTQPPDYGAMNIVSDYHFFRGCQLLQEGDEAQAVVEMGRACGLAWGIKEVYNNAASALAEAGLLVKASELYREALRLDEQYVNALWNQARTAGYLGNYQEASARFRKLQEITPKDFRVPGELGFLYLRRLGQTKEAIDAFRRSLALNAKQPQIHQALRALARSQAPELFPPVLQSTVTELEFGQVVLGQTRNRIVQLENVSSGDLKITDIRSDCGCVSASAKVRQVPEGGSVALKISIHEKRKLGPQDRVVTVETESGPPVKIQVRADIVGAYTVLPEAINIKDMLPGERAERTVRVVARDGSPTTIESIDHDIDGLRIIQEADPVAVAHDLRVVFAAGKKAGRVEGDIHIRFGDSPQERVVLPVSIEIEKVLTIKPRSLFLKNIERTSEVIRAVKVSIPRGWRAPIVKVTPSAPWIQAIELPDEIQDGTELKISLDTQTMPETFNGTLSVETNHASLPTIVIPIYGFMND